VRKKFIIATAAGALTLAGAAVAVPALADPDPVEASESRVERIRDALSGLVDDGSITEEQADEVATTLAGSDLGGGHGGRWGWFDLDTAAEALGMTEDELREALDADGATLARVAEAQDVAVDTLVDALVAEAETRLDEAVADGRLTQEQADERRSGLEEAVTERVNSTFPGRWGGWRGGDDD
jgi:polyhydroxyalkanoate synthesis regulator phasin